MVLTDDTVKEMLKVVSCNISRERKKRGLSMARLADYANLSVSHISKVESGQCEIGLKALLKISTALGMEMKDFLPDYLPETREIQTDGERFEQIMEGADPIIVEFILNMSVHMVRALEENVSYRKRKK